MNGMVTLQAAEVFQRAAGYIRQYGWQVTEMSEHGQPRCSMGALASAYPNKIWDENLSLFMYTKLYEELDGLSLTKFNYTHNSGEKVAQLYENIARKLIV